MNLNLTKEQQLILLGLIATIVVGLAVMAYRNLGGIKSDTITIESPKESLQTNQMAKLLVHVSGAVGKEGVYKLKQGDRCIDVLELAGGAQPNADLSAINLAEPVKDGAKIIVPVKRIVSERVSRAASQTVNLNTADEKALDSLPGVGPSTAKAIVEYRRINGPFARIEQIMEIPRFGKSKFERIKDRITI